MLQKIFILGVLGLFILNFYPFTAQAMTNPLQPGSLIKAASNAIYYYGADGKRYVFPNEKTYKTWFVDFSMVISIGDELLGEIPIGGNTTYKPGMRLVKITTDPKVYWVDRQGTLRHIASESIAKQLWGNTWYGLVDDLPDPFFINYKIGLPLDNPVISSIESDYSINEDKGLSSEPDPSPTSLGKINLTGYVENNSAFLTWTTTNLTADQGFKTIMANHLDPVYPGDFYHYLSEPTKDNDIWNELAAGTYYFRVCQYIDGKCGIYSNNLTLKVGSNTSPVSNSNNYIKLTAKASSNSALLTWTTNFTSVNGYKIVKSTEPNPVYPGNDYHYRDDSATRSETWADLSNGTYHFRVCEYLGSKCGVYSNDVTVTISNQADNINGSIYLNGSVINGVVSLNWSLTNMTSPNGFKVVKSTQPNPVYPGNDYHYLTDPLTRTNTWEGLGAGTYHFRVCEYLGGACGIYSNDLSLTVQ